MTKEVSKWRGHFFFIGSAVSLIDSIAGSPFFFSFSFWLAYSWARKGFNLHFVNSPWSLAFDCSEEDLGEVERRLSLVKLEMKGDGVDPSIYKVSRWKSAMGWSINITENIFFPFRLWAEIVASLKLFFFLRTVYSWNVSGRALKYLGASASTKLAFYPLSEFGVKYAPVVTNILYYVGINCG